MNILPPTVCPSAANPIRFRTQRSRAGLRNGAIGRGVTLIEMLVAMAITLIMMGAVISVFGLIGTNVAGNRALVEMSERMDSTRGRLQKDLAGATAAGRIPPLLPGTDAGYFEYVEGLCNDVSGIQSLPDYGMTGSASKAGYGVLGDLDDILMFTVRSNGEPFRGKAPGSAPGSFTPIQSQDAEVIWFVARNPDMSATAPGIPSYTLYRRVLLVAPAVDMSGVAPADFWKYDVSAHPNAAQTALVANTLGDLSNRENRYGHFSLTGPPAALFPYAVSPLVGFLVGNSRHGDDVILTNVLAFDVKLFDADAPVLSAGTGPALAPSDLGYANGTVLVARGAYVDLHSIYNNSLAYVVNDVVAYNGSSYICIKDVSGSAPDTDTTHWKPLPFTWASQASSQLSLPTYDTWSTHYEQDGVDLDGNGTIDKGMKGMNGLDDNGDGVVDDPSEFEIPPPYAGPLRGVQVKIRCYEPDSRQVREVTVVQDFLPNH